MDSRRWASRANSCRGARCRARSDRDDRAAFTGNFPRLHGARLRGGGKRAPYSSKGSSSFFASPTSLSFHRSGRRRHPADPLRRRADLGGRDPARAPRSSSQALDLLLDASRPAPERRLVTRGAQPAATSGAARRPRGRAARAGAGTTPHSGSAPALADRPRGPPAPLAAGGGQSRVAGADRNLLRARPRSDVEDLRRQAVDERVRSWETNSRMAPGKVLRRLSRARHRPGVEIEMVRRLVEEQQIVVLLHDDRELSPLLAAGEPAQRSGETVSPSRRSKRRQVRPHALRAPSPCGAGPRSRRSRASSDRGRGAPGRSTRPRRRGRAPPRRRAAGACRRALRRSVVLPVPFSPRMAIRSPRRARSRAPRTIRTPGSYPASRCRARGKLRPPVPVRREAERDLRCASSTGFSSRSSCRRGACRPRACFRSSPGDVPADEVLRSSRCARAASRRRRTATAVIARLSGVR